MNSKEIENLKVGDVVIFKAFGGEGENVIDEILKSKTMERTFIIYKTGNWDFAESFLKDVYKLKKQPQKIPYTAETFPESAIWITLKEWNNRKIKLRFDIHLTGLSYNGGFKNFSDIQEEGLKEIEIGCLTMNNKIEWKPFYQIK